MRKFTVIIHIDMDAFYASVEQMSFFEEERDKKKKIAVVLDKLHDKMGKGIIKKGSVL